MNWTGLVRPGQYVLALPPVALCASFSSFGLPERVDKCWERGTGGERYALLRAVRWLLAACAMSKAAGACCFVRTGYKDMLLHQNQASNCCSTGTSSLGHPWRPGTGLPSVPCSPVEIAVQKANNQSIKQRLLVVIQAPGWSYSQHDAVAA